MLFIIFLFFSTTISLSKKKEARPHTSLTFIDLDFFVDFSSYSVYVDGVFNKLTRQTCGKNPSPVQQQHCFHRKSRRKTTTSLFSDMIIALRRNLSLEN